MTRDQVQRINMLSISYVRELRNASLETSGCPPLRTSYATQIAITKVVRDGAA